MFRLAAVLLAVVVASSAQAGGKSSTMVTAGDAFAPPAFYAFCKKQPRLCSTRGKAKVVQLTSERQALLKSVNASVNRRIRERNDLIGGRATDEWDVPTKEGDCEDFAILKKAELLKRGWSASALLLTVATYGGRGHTVLTVRTDHGDLILDNRTNAIREWSKTPYKYFARQSQNDASKWTRIESGGT